MTTITPPLARPAPLAEGWSRLWRARRLVQRNVLVYKHQWLVILSGVFEPIFYLMGIGLGLGGIVRDVPLPDGRVVSYAAYVAPALLATAAMNGAVMETIFNVFFKLNFAHTYDAVLATPMGITEIALGEMLWALLRAALYAVAMLALMSVMGLVLSPWAVLLVPAALLVSAAFSSAGLAASAYLRSVNDFDIPMGLVVMPMFLFSGTFFPISIYPAAIQAFMQATPLYHAISLCRGLSTGLMGPERLWDLAYLVAFFAVAMSLALRRLERKLIK